MLAGVEGIGEVNRMPRQRLEELGVEGVGEVVVLIILVGTGTQTGLERTIDVLPSQDAMTPLLVEEGGGTEEVEEEIGAHVHVLALHRGEGIRDMTESVLNISIFVTWPESSAAMPLYNKTTGAISTSSLRNISSSHPSAVSKSATFLQQHS